MMGRTDYGHDHDAEAIQHMIDRAEVDYEKAKAESDASAHVTKQRRIYLDTLKRRLLHAEHRPQ